MEFVPSRILTKGIPSHFGFLPINFFIHLNMPFLKLMFISPAGLEPARTRTLSIKEWSRLRSHVSTSHLGQTGVGSTSSLTVSPVIPGYRVSTSTLSIQGTSFSNYLCYSESASSLFSSSGHVSFIPLTPTNSVTVSTCYRSMC